MRGKRTIFPILGALGLSGCLGSTDPCDPPFGTDIVSGASSMTQCIGSLSPTPAAQMPTSGTATYNGYVSGQLEPDTNTTVSVLGTATLNANFAATNPVSGTLGSFVWGNGQQLQGTLNLASGILIGNAFSATISGTLNGYPTGALNIDATGAGVFLGDGAEAISASTSGTVTNTGSSHSGPASLVIVGHQ